MSCDSGLARGWGGRIRASAWKNQDPLPYHCNYGDSCPDAPARSTMAKCKNEMDVVGRQTRCPYLDRSGAATLREQIAIDRLIAGFEEHRLTAVATSRHGVREAGDDDAANTPHAHTLASLVLIVQYANCSRNSVRSMREPRLEHLQTVGTYMQGSAKAPMQSGIGRGGSACGIYLRSLADHTERTLI
jgi:hypothetical protein